METKGDKQRASAKGMILSACPLCKGTGKIPKEVPFLANPKAPATQAEKAGLKTCQKCHGSGIIGIK